MGQIKYDIDTYEISIELATTDEGNRSNTFGMITLFSQMKNVAELNFTSPDHYVAKKYLSGEQLNVNLPRHKFDSVVDLLRNEKPIRLVIWYEGDIKSPSNLEARLATAELEPVGEGE
jgi:6-pyruvoyl-tetrahydropterin synthase